MEWSIKVFHILFILLGLALWAYLARIYLSRGHYRIIFLSLLVPQLLAWGVYPSALASWAVLPLILILTVGFEQGWRTHAALGLCLTYFVALRYQNAALLPAVGLYFLWSSWGNKIYLLKSWALALGPPALAIIAIFVLNRINAGMANPIRVPMDPSWDWVWIPDFLSTFLFASSYRLDDVARYALSAAGAGGAASAVLRVSALALSLACAARVGMMAKSTGPSKNLAVFFLFAFFSVAAFFLALAISLNFPLFTNGRYFHLLWPMLALAIATSLPQWGAPKFTLSLAIVAAAVSFAAAVQFSSHRRALSSEFSDKAKAVFSQIESIRSGDPSAAVFVFADHMFPSLALTHEYAVAMETNDLLKSNAWFSKPTWLIFVSDTAPMKPQFTRLANLEEIETRFGLLKASVGSLRFSWKKFEPGKLLERGVSKPL